VKKLLAYLNSLSQEERQRLEAATGTTVAYLRKAVSAKQRIGAEICVAIEKATEGKVSRRDLRPMDWQLIWPELVTSERNPARRPHGISVGEFGDPRSGTDRRDDGDRRTESDPSFGELGEPRDGDRRQEDRRSTDTV
jgi:DNA-binding transcriptional regulator YdaS (Cro superfamily)